MTDDQKTLLRLKNILRMDSADDSLRIAPEYAPLSAGRTFYYRNGRGTVFETASDVMWVNSYTEDYLNDELMLQKYRGNVMRSEEVQRFLENSALAAIRAKQGESLEAISIICATLFALDYDGDWIEEMFKPCLLKSWSAKQDLGL